MPHVSATLGTDSIHPSPQRSMGLGSTFALWLAANMVVTTLLTGMLLIPDLTISQALTAIVGGSLLGAIPLAFTGLIGTRTGLPTMVVARAAFGQRGAALPALVNTLVLIGWSWIQAYLAGLSLNFASEQLFGFSNINLFIIVTEALVVAITLYGHRGIESLERLVSACMLVLSGVVFVTLFTRYDGAALWQLPAADNPQITLAIAFDVVIATAFSWMSSVCDFNRYCRTGRASVLGTYLGYLGATVLAMGLGVTVAGFSLLGGLEKTYDPTVLLADSGFGLVASLVIFLSVLSTNVMALYSASFSLLSVLPGRRFWSVTLVIGLLCLAGALLRENLMAGFFDFVLLVSTLFIPVFAIILTDYYVCRAGHYDAGELVLDRAGDYRYLAGINPAACAAYLTGALFAFWFTYLDPLATGSSVLTFGVTALVYAGAMQVSQAGLKEKAGYG